MGAPCPFVTEAANVRFADLAASISSEHLRPLMAKARREVHDDLAVERGGAHDPSGPVAGEIFRWDLGRECSQDGVGTL